MGVLFKITLWATNKNVYKSITKDGRMASFGQLFGGPLTLKVQKSLVLRRMSSDTPMRTYRTVADHHLCVNRGWHTIVSGCSLTVFTLKGSNGCKKGSSTDPPT